MRWAVVGCGNVWQTKSRAAFQDIGGTIPNKKYEHLADDLISHSMINAVYIATPPDSHLHYARLAAKHKKPCLVEKPMALDKIEAGIMASLFQEAGVPLWVAYYRRCLPQYIEAKRVIESGEIGTVISATIRHWFPPRYHPVAPIIEGQPIPWRYDPKINGGGNFVDMGTHHIDLVDYLLGRIVRVEGHKKNATGLYEAEDTVTAFMVTERNIPVTGMWCYATAAQEDSFEILGTNGKLEITAFNKGGGFVRKSAFELQKFSGPQDTIDQTCWVCPSEPLNGYDGKWTHQPLVQSIVDELDGKGKCPTNWENGLRAMVVQEKILGAAQD